MSTERLDVLPLTAPVDADIAVPGSKSYTNRALVCAALARGTSTLTGPLVSEDTAAMLDCLAALGIGVQSDEAGSWLVDGCDGRIPNSSADLACRLSGTTARFITPVACLGEGPYRITGEPSLLARPMAGQFSALRALGSLIASERVPNHLPVQVRRGTFRGGSVQVPGNASSQFLSGLLLAAPCYPEGIDVEVTTDLVSRSYVDLTLDTIDAFGGRVVRADGVHFQVEYGGYLDILTQMGCTVSDNGKGLEVTGPAKLHGVTVDMQNCSDVAQTLAAIAPFADGPTRITGIGFIRRKETDRIAAMVNELQRCGIHAIEEADGVLIQPGEPQPASIHTYDDHRMAMSFALVGLRVPGISILDPGCVAKTFPRFWDTLDTLRN